MKAVLIFMVLLFRIIKNNKNKRNKRILGKEFI